MSAVAELHEVAQDVDDTAAWGAEEWIAEAEHREENGKSGAECREKAHELEREALADDQVAELRQEAGEAVGPMPPKEPESPLVAPDRMIVSGPAQKKLWSGKGPGSCVLKVRGLSVDVEDGTFEKGEIVTATVTLRIVSEGVKDKLDKHTKTPTEAVEVLDATVVDFEVAD